MRIHGLTEPLHDVVQAFSRDETDFSPVCGKGLQRLQIDVSVVCHLERFNLLKQGLLQNKIGLFFFAAVGELGFFGLEEHVLCRPEFFPELVLVPWGAWPRRFPILLEANHRFRGGLPVGAVLDSLSLFDQGHFFLLADLARGFDTVVEHLFALEEHIGCLSELSPKSFVVFLACKACGFPFCLQRDNLLCGGLPPLVVFDVFSQGFLDGCDQPFLFSFVHFELGPDGIVVLLDGIKGGPRQSKKGVRHGLEGLPRGGTNVEPLLLKGTGERFTFFQTLHGFEGLGLGNEGFFQLQILLQVMLLELLVDVDVVEKLVPQTMVFIVHFAVAVSRNIPCGFPLLTHLIEPGKGRADVLFFLDGFFELIDQCELHFQVGTLLLCNLLLPGFLPLFELRQEPVEFNFFRAGLKLEFVVGIMFRFRPRLALGAEVFLDQGTKRLDLTAHILSDGLQVLVAEERLDTLQNF